MTAEADWQFASNELDEDRGLADAGVETYRSTPFQALARECGQNSLDAADQSTEQNGVLLEFRRISVRTETVPGLTKLRTTMSACLRRAGERSSKKEVEFFREAERILSQEEIDVLQVVDSGTRGLRGPPVPGSPFHALVKGNGVSSKADNAGGSFGIGKSAAYVVSKLRTVLYSTLYRDGSKDVFYAQGKTLLTSHIDADGNSRQNIGYWGVDMAKPVEAQESTPRWLRRSHQGTTVSSLGFAAEPDWSHEVTESLLRNFFPALARGRMHFRVDQQPINKQNFIELFDNQQVRDAADQRGTLENLEFASALQRCIASESASRIEIDIPDLGRMRLHLLVEVGLPKRVGILRNDMFITDNLQHFRNGRFSRFPLQKDFVAALEPVDPAATTLMRELENPAHDDLSPERIDDLARRKKVIRAFGALVSWIRDSIRDRTQSATSLAVALDELNPFFASPEKQERVTGDSKGEEHPETALIVLKPNRRKKEQSGAGGAGELGGGGGRSPNGSDGGRTSGTGAGAGTQGTGNVGGHKIPVGDLRNVILRGGTRHVRRLSFTPLADAEVRLQVVASGLANATVVPFERVDGGAAVFRVFSGQRMSVDVNLFIPFSGPVEVALIPQERANETE